MSKSSESALEEQDRKTREDFAIMDCKVEIVNILNNHTYYSDLIQKLKDFVNK